MTGLNVGAVSNTAAPFAGWQHSGPGHGGIHEYLQTKYTLTPNPFAWPHASTHRATTPDDVGSNRDHLHQHIPHDHSEPARNDI
jgi:hypothetical protein